MASYLKPRRGTYSTAASKLTSSSAGVLKNGEIFFELNASGAGKGMGKIKMGDGSTNYSSLPYFLSLTDCGISFTANESTDQISSLVSGVTIPNAFRYIKSSLAYLKTQVTNLNNDFCGYKLNIKNLGITSDIEGRICLKNIIPENSIGINITVLNGASTSRATNPMWFDSEKSYYSAFVNDLTHEPIKSTTYRCVISYWTLS